MSYCGATTLLGYDQGQVSGSLLRCRCWHCPECLPYRLRQLCQLAKAGRPNKFLTLTCRPQDSETPDQLAQRMRTAFRALIQWLQRHGYGDHIPYLVIFEEHRSGFPHLHVLMRSDYIPQRVLSDRWYRLTGSPVVDIRRPRTVRGVAAYVSKYVSKGPARYHGCKRYWRSRDYVVDASELPIRIPRPGAIWWRSREYVEDERWRWEACGWVVIDESPERWQASTAPGCTWPRDCATDPPPDAPKRRLYT